MKMNLTSMVDASKGRPLDLALGDVRPDPHQPRTVFEPVALQELADSIALRGVKMPISVRRDPAAPGKYIINLGERRFHASKLAGKPSIPAFVDESCTSYDQVVENLQRADLTPLEIATFIAERLAAGEKKSEIAKGVGKPRNFVTYHLALVDAPPVVVAAYAAGVTSPQTLYDLRNLHDKQPAAVEAWVASGADVNRDAIRELAEIILHEELSGEPQDAAGISHEELSGVPAAGKISHEELSGQPKSASGISHEELSGVPAAGKISHEELSGQPKSASGISHEELSGQPQGAPGISHEEFSARLEAKKISHEELSAPARPSKVTPSHAPLAHAKAAPAGVPIMAVHQGRKVFVEPSMVRVRYEGSTEVVEVALSELSM